MIELGAIEWADHIPIIWTCKHLNPIIIASESFQCVCLLTVQLHNAELF